MRSKWRRPMLRHGLSSTTNKEMELLFSYGTLQLEKVQMASFGRILKGTKDAILGYKLSTVEITDKDVLEKSGQQFHPVAMPSTNTRDKIDGVVFEITKEELAKADEYEVDDYIRVEAEP